MKFTVITIFPNLIEDYFKEGILSRALKLKQVKLKTVSPRKFTKDRHQTVDALPYGGGAGLVMKVEPLVKAIQSVVPRLRSGNQDQQKVAPRQARDNKIKQRIILLDPRGKRFRQKDAERLVKYDELIFVSGRYEGIDERVKHYVDEKISVGDFILMGGELPALVIMEAVARLIPEVLHHPHSAKYESFSDGKTLEHPHYTRPEVFNGRKVPKVLLSGHHGKIKEWRKKQSG